MLAWLWCRWRRRHDPVRHPLGGFRCADCGFLGADLDDMGFYGNGWVTPVRQRFVRDAVRVRNARS